MTSKFLIEKDKSDVSQTLPLNPGEKVRFARVSGFYNLCKRGHPFEGELFDWSVTPHHHPEIRI